MNRGLRILFLARIGSIEAAGGAGPANAAGGTSGLMPADGLPADDLEPKRVVPNEMVHILI
jgi:hypothetical protein